MEWKTEDLWKLIAGSTVLTAIIGKAMGWLRFGKSDKANVGKVEAETAVDLATVNAKKISDEIKISEAALQWTINLSSRLEKANAMIDRKQQENDRLHDIISKIKHDFDEEVQKLKNNFNKRIRELESEFEKSKNELLKEREENREEIKKLKNQIYGTK